jgi:CheY-like chemotaxis protein
MGASQSPGGLYGLRVLVVEDETMVAMMLEDMLAEFGCVIAGVAGTVAQAMERVQSSDEIDAAILDVNVGGEKIYPVADALVEREVPFVFSTGYGPGDLAQRYPNSQTLAKPYEAEALADVLAECAHRSPPHLRQW